MGVYPIHNLKSQACKNEDVSESQSQSPLHSNIKPINNSHRDNHKTHFIRTIICITRKYLDAFGSLFIRIPFKPQKLHVVPEFVFNRMETIVVDLFHS